jgi:YesN/AraC family two-component response regulator
MNQNKYTQVTRSIDVNYNEDYKEWESENHNHNDYEIIFIAEGKVQLKVNDKLYFPDAHSMIFISNLESHELKVLEYPYKRYFIKIKPDFLQSIISEPLLLSIFQYRPEAFNHIVTLKPQEEKSILDTITRMHAEYNKKNPFWEAVVKIYIYMLLITVYRISEEHFPLSRLNSSMNNVIIEIQKYIEEHFTEDISLKEISKLFYTDMYYLCHLFKSATGYTFKSYLTLQRISKAKDLLFYTDDDVTQVGLNSGFNNVNHFIRTFRKIVGITPFQYRKKYRSDSTFKI